MKLTMTVAATGLLFAACNSDPGKSPWSSSGSGGALGVGGAPVGGTPSGSGGTPGSATGGAASSAAGASTSASGGSAGSATGGTSSKGGASAAGSGGTSTTGGAGGLPASGGVTATDGGVTGTDGGEPQPDSGANDWGPGDYPPDINSQNYLEISGVKGQAGNVRQYKVHVPPNYDPKIPAPVVFCIHGLFQNAVMFCVAGAAMDKKSDQEGFILVMPNGYQASWNAGSCCGAASTSMLDDVALFRAIFKEVATHVNIDRRRVYATGLSNGGYMSYRLACDAADLFTAVAPGAGAVGTNDIGGGTNTMSDFTTCTPSRPVSVLDMHGTADPLIAYSVQAPSLKVMTGADKCGTTTAPSTTLPTAGDTTCLTYQGCPAGIEVSACSVQGGGHCWFGSSDCGTGAGALGAAFVGANSDTLMATDAVWSFLQRQVR